MTMAQATLTEWKAKEGDWVEKGSVVLVIETEKVAWDIAAGALGFLHILFEEGCEIMANTVVGLIAETKEELEMLQREQPRIVYSTGVKEVPRPESFSVTPTVAIGGISKANPDIREQIRISPVARKIAEENMLDITQIKGTGPGGRVVKEDIEKAIEERKRGEIPSTAGPAEVYQGRRVKATIPLKGMRKAIAEHMYRSLASSAQMTLFGEFDASEFVRLKGNLAGEEERIGTRITYTEIMVFIIAKALRDHSDINCSLIDNEIKVWDDINVGVAVALGKEGLIVPVVKNADQKSLVEISKITKVLIEKAQTGKLMPDDVTGGTFTLTSMGAAGVTFFQTPIINQLESAILGIGPIREKPMVRDGQIVIGPVLTYSLTFDHRVINGFGAEQFLGRLWELLNNPGLLLL